MMNNNNYESKCKEVALKYKELIKGNTSSFIDRDTFINEIIKLDLDIFDVYYQADLLD